MIKTIPHLFKNGDRVTVINAEGINRISRACIGLTGKVIRYVERNEVLIDWIEFESIIEEWRLTNANAQQQGNGSYNTGINQGIHDTRSAFGDVSTSYERV